MWQYITKQCNPYSSTLTELGALYIKAKVMAPICTHMEMGHPQPPMPIQTDHSTVFGVITNKLIHKVTKEMDMHYHWLQHREQQQQFRFYWRPCKKNYANYWMKDHAATPQSNMTPIPQHSPKK